MTSSVRTFSITISPDESHPTSVEYDATVIVTEITGNESIVHLEFAGQSCVAVVDGTVPLGAGKTIAAYLDPDCVFVFDNTGQTIASPARPVNP